MQLNNINNAKPKQQKTHIGALASQYESHILKSMRQNGMFIKLAIDVTAGWLAAATTISIYLNRAYSTVAAAPARYII